METITSVVRNVLPIPHAVAKVIGYHQMETIANGLFKVGDGLLPLWTQYTPSGAKKLKRNIYPASSSHAPMVVYFPACITRSMGPSADYDTKVDTPTTMLQLLHKANYTVIIPEEKDKLCCGMAFSSKGFRKEATQKESELNEALLRASRNGELPIVCDMSPCLLHIKQTLDPRLRLYDQVDFIHDFLLSKLQFEKQPITVSIHTTCSSTKMELATKLHTIASLCAQRVVVPADITCCGWAGDRGFFYPQLSQSALAPLKENNANATEGYSNSRTCEIGLSTSSGISYKSVVYLVNRATKALNN
jgi:D-lactate dehydrogenase